MLESLPGQMPLFPDQEDERFRLSDANLVLLFSQESADKAEADEQHVARVTPRH
jgi:hypothetical protein